MAELRSQSGGAPSGGMGLPVSRRTFVVAGERGEGVFSLTMIASHSFLVVSPKKISKRHQDTNSTLSIFFIVVIDYGPLRLV